jgi:hypothetical protein
MRAFNHYDTDPYYISPEEEGCLELFERLEDDESFVEMVEQIRADRISKGANPDTGLPDSQP